MLKGGRVSTGESLDLAEPEPTFQFRNALGVYPICLGLEIKHQQALILFKV